MQHDNRRHTGPEQTQTTKYSLVLLTTCVRKSW